MKILVADKIPHGALAELEALGHRVSFHPEFKAGDLAQAVADKQAHVLVVRSTKVGRPVFEANSPLSLVIRAGAGVNTIDLGAAGERGVFVANCPGKNAIAVAELTMGLILAMDRRLPEAVADLRAGRWRKKEYGRAGGLHGRRLGLVGLGAIGCEVAVRARAFGMEVHAWTPSLDAKRAETLDVVAASNLDELLSSCDVVSIHCPYSKATQHMIGARELGLLRDGAMLVHTARGGVVDDDALREAVTAGRIQAALDVFEDEPAGGDAAFDGPLREVDGLYGTPHIGASTDQAASAIGSEVVRIIQDYAVHGSVPNVVNVASARPTRHALVVRHRDEVGVLASVLQSLRREALSVKEMQNVIFAGGDGPGAACATIVTERAPSNALLEALRAGEHVLAVDLRVAD